MATGMNGNLMAKEVLEAIGGEVSNIRSEAFERMCNAIVRHIQKNMVVSSTVSGGSAVSIVIR